MSFPNDLLENKDMANVRNSILCSVHLIVHFETFLQGFS